jgi:hypothetical protein
MTLTLPGAFLRKNAIIASLVPDGKRFFPFGQTLPLFFP